MFFLSTWIPKAVLALAKSSFVCPIALVVPGLQVFQRCRQLVTRRLAGAPQGTVGLIASDKASSCCSRIFSQLKKALSTLSRELLTLKLEKLLFLFSEWVGFFSSICLKQCPACPGTQLQETTVITFPIQLFKYDYDPGSGRNPSTAVELA